MPSINELINRKMLFAIDSDWHKGSNGPSKLFLFSKIAFQKGLTTFRKEAQNSSGVSKESLIKLSTCWSNITVVLPSFLRIQCRLGRLSMNFATNLVVLTISLILRSRSMCIYISLRSRTIKDKPFWLPSSSIIKVMIDSKLVGLIQCSSIWS